MATVASDGMTSVGTYYDREQEAIEIERQRGGEYSGSWNVCSAGVGGDSEKTRSSFWAALGYGAGEEVTETNISAKSTAVQNESNQWETRIANSDKTGEASSINTTEAKHIETAQDIDNAIKISHCENNYTTPKYELFEVIDPQYVPTWLHGTCSKSGLLLEREYGPWTSDWPRSNSFNNPNYNSSFQVFKARRDEQCVSKGSEKSGIPPSDLPNGIGFMNAVLDPPVWLDTP